MNPSPWIARFGASVVDGGLVGDVACGAGRHTRWFAERGHPVVALDRDLSGVADLRADARVELVECDLEVGAAVPIAAESCAAVVVTNYLWRPILDELVALVAPGGWLLYETFAVGNERYGRPTNPEFLLRPGELLELATRHSLHVVAYEDVVVDDPRPVRAADRGYSSGSHSVTALLAASRMRSASRRRSLRGRRRWLEERHGQR